MTSPLLWYTPFSFGGLEVTVRTLTSFLAIGNSSAKVSLYLTIHNFKLREFKQTAFVFQ